MLKKLQELLEKQKIEYKKRDKITEFSPFINYENEMLSTIEQYLGLDERNRITKEMEKRKFVWPKQIIAYWTRYIKKLIEKKEE